MVQSVDGARVLAFEAAYKCSNIGTYDKSITKFDDSYLPPSRRELEQHIRRTALISRIWVQARSQMRIALTPEECGWLTNHSGTLEFS